jgi:hypothetical protein
MEIIPKDTPKIPPWLDILFYLSVGLLIFVLISYFLVSQSIKASLKSQEELDAQLADSTSKSAKLKNEILTYQKKIKDFSGIIGEHAESSNIFSFIEKQCHPRVWFSGFEYNTKDIKVIVTGEAQSFQSLGQQMLIFRAEDMISSASLYKVSMEKGGKIGFEISISFAPSIIVFK